MNNIKLIKNLNNELQAELPQCISRDEILQTLSEFVNHLVQTDFQRLVFILYKTDVSEKKLKLLLQQNPREDAAPVIAKLIIERQLQKIDLRSAYSKRNDIPEEEKW